jgi:hypothetical protein
MLNQKLGVSCFYHFLLFQELASSQDPVRLKQDLEGQVWRKLVSANLSVLQPVAIPEHSSTQETIIKITTT